MATVLIWRKQIINLSPGHAALQIHHAYISWWPAREQTVSPAIEHYTWKEDKAAEGKYPDVQITIIGLDETRIVAWWRKVRNEPDWDLLRNNCCTLVARALVFGGANQLSPGWNAGIDVWAPWNLEIAVRKLVARGRLQ